MKILNIKTLEKHLTACYPFEGCGIVVNSEYLPQKNIAEDTVNSFLIDPEVYLEHEKTLEAVIHSHTCTKEDIDPRCPTKADMIGANATRVPWGIVHVEEKRISDILWFNENKKYSFEALVGRKYIPNVYDCFTICKDYYLSEHNIKCSLIPRNINWDKENPFLMEQGFLNFGFKLLDQNAKHKEGDILMFKIGSKYVNHLGVVLHGGQFLHHLYKRKSSVDSISKWNKYIVKRYRLL